MSDAVARSYNFYPTGSIGGSTTMNAGSGSQSVCGQSNNSTYCSSHFMQTTHAQIRRKQRNILYKDVKAAIKYGTRTPHIWYSDLKLKRKRQQQAKLLRRSNGHQRASSHNTHTTTTTTSGGTTCGSIYKYTYKDLVYIVNEREQREITCYTKPIELLPIPIPTLQGISTVAANTSTGTPISSHTVMIIDTSGSMKTSDVWGTRNRLDAVWMAIAIDFLALRIQEQEQQRTGKDVITIILMKEGAQVLYRCVPITWALYNQFVHIYNQRQTIPPSGHGCYIPSLAVAEQIINECSLDSNHNINTVTLLLLLSDGVPSDRKNNQIQIMNLIQSITLKHVQIGSPFQFTAIGIGDGSTGGSNTDSNKFPILRQMVQTALNNGATSAQLKVPSMSCTSFGQTFTSVATSISTSMTLDSEPSPPRHSTNDVRGGFRTIVLQDDDEDDVDQQQQFCINRSVQNVFQSIHEVTLEKFNLYPVSGITRRVCNASDHTNVSSSTFVPVPFQHVDTRYVAIAKEAFDEGIERVVYQFYEVADDRKTILGVPMVAKESRRMTKASTNNRQKPDDDYARTFCFTQHIAKQMAIQFNRRLYGNPQQIPIDTPRVSFLDCSIYEIYDPTNGRRFDILVESMIDHTKWYKWNSNNGWRNNHIEQLPGHSALEQIIEVDEEDEMIDHDDSDLDHVDQSNEDVYSRHVSNLTTQQQAFTVSQVAQAFSHFSYWLTNGQCLVCDLQGIYNVERNTLQLSDPVIHSNHGNNNISLGQLIDQRQDEYKTNDNRRDCNHRHHYHNLGNDDRMNQFGRTNRGWKGIDDFFMTHRCEEQHRLCQLVMDGGSDYHPFNHDDNNHDDEYCLMKV